MKFYIVGSALTKAKPRDVDLYGVLEDHLFTATFNMTLGEFQVQRRSPKLPEKLRKWQNHNLGATRVLQFVFPEFVPLDFKFMPESLLQEPYKEVDITTPPTTWGIGLPGLQGEK